MTSYRVTAGVVASGVAGRGRTSLQVFDPNWVDCAQSQTWSLTFDKSAGFGSRLFGSGSNNTINPVTAAPQLFRYAFTQYKCVGFLNLGTACDEKVDFADNRGPLPGTGF